MSYHVEMIGDVLGAAGELARHPAAGAAVAEIGGLNALNPFSSEFIPWKVAASAAEAVEEKIDKLEAAVDPVPFAVAMVGGDPTWGYWAPGLVKVAAVVAVVGVGALAVHKAKKKRGGKRRRR